MTFSIKMEFNVAVTQLFSLLTHGHPTDPKLFVGTFYQSSNCLIWTMTQRVNYIHHTRHYINITLYKHNIIIIIMVFNLLIIEFLWRFFYLFCLQNVYIYICSIVNKYRSHYMVWRSTTRFIIFSGILRCLNHFIYFLFFNFFFV